MGVRRDGDGEGETGTPSLGGDSTHTEHPSRASGSRDGEQAHREGRPPPVAPPPAPPLNPSPLLPPPELSALVQTGGAATDQRKRSRIQTSSVIGSQPGGVAERHRRARPFSFFSLLTARCARTREALCAEQASEPP